MKREATQIKDRKEQFARAEALLKRKNYTIADADRSRPWGGFFVIEESEAMRFADEFFPGLDLSMLHKFSKLSPKLLLVAPGRRLSWQYHNRRSERWRVIEGDIGIVRSDTDEQGEMEQLSEGDTVRLAQGERHRLVGLEGWSLLAEIWQHTDPENPSDENDIVRVEDDFGR